MLICSTCTDGWSDNRPVRRSNNSNYFIANYLLRPIRTPWYPDGFSQSGLAKVDCNWWSYHTRVWVIRTSDFSRLSLIFTRAFVLQIWYRISHFLLWLFILLPPFFIYYSALLLLSKSHKVIGLDMLPYVLKSFSFSKTIAFF